MSHSIHHEGQWDFPYQGIGYKYSLNANGVWEYLGDDQGRYDLRIDPNDNINITGLIGNNVLLTWGYHVEDYNNWWGQGSFPYGADPQDNVNHPMAISGDTVFVGAPRENNNVGAVYVFKNGPGEYGYGTQFSQVQKLTPPIKKDNAFFGFSLAASGNVLVVGQPSIDNPSTNNSIYVYKYNGSSWQLVFDGSAPAAMSVLNTQPASRFGYSVAISGNIIAVGAPDERQTGRRIGAVHLYNYNESNTLTAPLSRSNATSPASTPGNASKDTKLNTYYVITVEPLGQPLFCPDVNSPTPDDRDFGGMVAISGNTVVAGDTKQNTFYRITMSGWSAVSGTPDASGYTRPSGSSQQPISMGAWQYR